MGQKSRRKNFKYDEDEPVFESDEYFAYIAEYTSGGVPYGITWDEAKEIAKCDSEFGRALALIAPEENKNDTGILLPF